MNNWQKSADLVIVGSGGGGLVAALAAQDAGMTPIVIEKQPLLGGSTAMSGGVVWLPNNPLMKAAGVPDSHADGLAYLEAVVGDAGPCSSPARREAFLTEAYTMIEFLLKEGLLLERCQGYSDYYPDHKGGNADGRSIEGLPFDAHELGDWHDKIMPGMAKAFGLAVKTNEVRSISCYNRSPGAFAVAARVWLRTKLGQLRKQDLLTNGGSLVGQLVKLLLARGVTIWTGSSVQGLVVDRSVVTGVRVSRDGGEVLVEARRGVLLAAGGFARNRDMRRKYSGSQPNEAEWTMANPGDTGEVLEQAVALGADTDLLDEAWWNPVTLAALGNSTLSLARQRPGAIFVNKAGLRYCNESNSYVEVGKAMYANDGVPSWLVFDDGYRRRYAHQRSGRPGQLQQSWVEEGLIRQAGTVRDLARLIDVPEDALDDTVSRWNQAAAKGQDPLFGRGVGAYNRCLGDPGHKINPAVGPLDQAPFYATLVFPGDVGTCGGLLTDEYARVLRTDGTAIPGLYATGNITATVMGRTYPGAGASIANTMAFGYIAAHHAASKKDAPG